MRALLALISLVPASASAAPLFECASLGDVRQLLSYCSDNVDAVNSALECYDKIGEAWETTGAELRRTLSGLQAREHTRQQGELGFTASDYHTSVKKMDGLIETSEFNLARVHTYSTVMLDYIGGGTAETSAKCYLENVERLRSVETEIRRLIAEGSATRDQALGLGGASESFKNGLAGMPGGGPAGGVRETASGNSRNGASDVTGVARDIAKGRSLASGGVGLTVSHPALRPEDDPSFVPVTGELPARAKTSRSQILSSFAGPLLGDSEPLGSEAGAGAERIDSSESAQRNSASVGALLFTRAGGGGALVLAPAPGSAESGGKDASVPDDAAARGNGIPFVASPGASSALEIVAAAAEREAHGSAPLVLASTEESLFAAVHTRYRETELFRKARVITVPLDAFAAKP